MLAGFILYAFSITFAYTKLMTETVIDIRANFASKYSYEKGKRLPSSTIILY